MSEEQNKEITLRDIWNDNPFGFLVYLAGCAVGCILLIWFITFVIKEEPIILEIVSGIIGIVVLVFLWLVDLLAKIFTNAKAMLFLVIMVAYHVIVYAMASRDDLKQENDALRLRIRILEHQNRN